MTEAEPVAVIGAGAMGTALATHLARNGSDVTLLATDRDPHVLAAWRKNAPHPALQVPFQQLRCYPVERWAEVLPQARLVFVAVSSAGLGRVLAEAAANAAPEAWVLATKGWEMATLRTPSEVAAAVLGDAPVVSLGGPGLAAEIMVASPTGLLCAATDRQVRHRAARALISPTTMAFTSSDVAGVETASAFKNVVAVAVGLAEGLAERLGQSALVRSFGNARAAVFASGMLDMKRLVEARGGRATTVFGLAGAGDLYVTCQHGRNGRLGRLLGTGASVEEAMRSIGSTVEGIDNTTAALQLAERSGIDLPSARIVEGALRHGTADDGAIDRLREVFVTALGPAGLELNTTALAPFQG
jgi:glycerol-3-phosphate dehydrogenase (NAD(P)+)